MGLIPLATKLMGRGITAHGCADEARRRPKVHDKPMRERRLAQPCTTRRPFTYPSPSTFGVTGLGLGLVARPDVLVRVPRRPPAVNVLPLPPCARLRCRGSSR